MQPMLDGMFEVGARGLVTAHFLVDAITSASSGSGAANAAFTERRYEGGAGYTHELDGPAALTWLDRIRLGGEAKYSTESDYESLYLGGRAEADVAQKNAVFGLGGGIATDTITNAGAQSPMGGPLLACDARETLGTEAKCALTTYVGFASASQILSKNALVAVTYDVSKLDGFQANPYRLAITASGLEPERHPNARLRQAVAISGRLYVPATQTTFIGAYRYYRDDWHIRAHTPELRIVQEVGALADASIRYRYYHQTAAYFYKDRYPALDTTMIQYITDDPKMSAFMATCSRPSSASSARSSSSRPVGGRAHRGRARIHHPAQPIRRRGGGPCCAHGSLRLLASRSPARRPARSAPAAAATTAAPAARSSSASSRPRDQVNLVFGDLVAGANNDCPDPAAPAGVISLTISGTEMGATGLVTFCVPRPDQLATMALPLGRRVKIIDLSASDAACTYAFDASKIPTGTAKGQGMCGNGSDAAGFAMIVDGFIGLQRTCGATVDTVVRQARGHRRGRRAVASERELANPRDDRAQQIARAGAQQVRLADHPGDRRAEGVVGLDAELAEDVGLEQRVAEVAEQLDVVRHHRAVGGGRDEAGVDRAGGPREGRDLRDREVAGVVRSRRTRGRRPSSRSRATGPSSNDCTWPASSGTTRAVTGIESAKLSGVIASLARTQMS